MSENSPRKPEPAPGDIERVEPVSPAESAASVPSSGGEGAEVVAPRDGEGAEVIVSGDGEGAAAMVSSDAEIVARISSVVHEPFREAWRRYEDDVWGPLGRTLERAAAAHERALAGMRGDPEPDSAEERRFSGDDAAAEAGGQATAILARYRQAVADDVLEPLRAALAGTAAATSLEESLASTAGRVRASLAGLPPSLEAHRSRTPGANPSDAGPLRRIKRACARALGPLVRRGRTRSVPVARLARQHLDQVVLRAQAGAFRESQRVRAGWLGHLERVCAAWTDAVLQRPPDDSAAEPGPPFDDTGAHLAAGAALGAELHLLLDDIGRASGTARGEYFEHAGELLHASVGVAGTFAADPPSSRPLVGRQRELARRWDTWAEGASARLELYRSLVAIRRRADELLRELGDGWTGIVRKADAVAGRVEVELERGRERVESLSGGEAELSQAIEAARTRTDRALGRVQDALPDPDALFEELAAEAEQAIDSLDAMRARMPEALALHDIPEAGEPPSKPTADPRTVRLRDTALKAFDTLRRERIRAAPSSIREAMRRLRSEVAELRDVSGYGYEAAIAELKDTKGAPSIPPIGLVTNGLQRAGIKAGAAQELLGEALAEARTRVAREVADGARHLIERATADRMTAGYLEARTYLTARMVRGWRRWRGRLAHAGARLRAGSAIVLGSLRRLVGSLGIGPGARAVADPHESTLAYADEFPRTLPVVYRRLFSPEPLTDPRLLAGRDDALAAVAAAWTRWKAGDPRSLVVIASPGAGMTSFLNIAAGRLAEDAPDGARRAFRDRLREESHIAARLAAWLGLEAATDLDALADQVREAPSGTLPRYAVLEAAEHLYMRAPGGSRLVERLLTFMSRTESKVFWIVAMRSSAWQLVEKHSPAFVHDLDRVVLRELSAGQLKQAILARHRLSGLPLRYAEPRDGRAVLRRWRGTDKHARLVEEDYFQRLQRTARGSIRLGLFHWLRSADFAAVEGSLLVRPFESLKSGMGRLEVAHRFALKAMLDHGTLTVAEYCEVARVAGPECLHLFRSMEEDRIIEAVPDGVRGRTGADPGSRGRGTRYCIRPIMIGAVTAHLRSRNILH